MIISHFKSELYQKLPLLNTRFATQKNLFSMQGLNTNRAAENQRPIYGALIQKRWRFRKFPDTGCYLFPDAKAKEASLAGPFQQVGCTFYWHGQPDQASFSLLMPTTASVSLRLYQVGESPPYLHTIREEYYPLLFVYGPSSTVRETRYRSWSWNPEDIRRKRSTKGVLTSSPRFSVMLFDISAYWAKCLALEWKCRILQRALEILLAVGDWAPTCTPTPSLFSAPRISRSTHEQTPDISLYFPGFIYLSGDWILHLQTNTMAYPWKPTNRPMHFVTFSWVSKPKRRRSPHLHTNTKTSFSTPDIQKHLRTNPRYFVILSWVYKPEQRLSPPLADEKTYPGTPTNRPRYFVILS